MEKVMENISVMNRLISFLRKDKIFLFIFLITLLSYLRTVFIPLKGDEITYQELAQNILMGKYYFRGQPSTITPVIPFIISIFHISAFPSIGLAIAKLVHFTLALMGMRYIYLFLRNQNFDDKIIFSLLALTFANPISVSFFSSLFPEPILMFSFWGFIYFVTQPPKLSHLKFILFFFVLSLLTRYLYAVLLLPLGIYYLQLLFKRKQKTEKIFQLAFHTTLFVLISLTWFKYVYITENSQINQVSYFSRFEGESSFLTNVKSGLGLVKHPEVKRINGIPAFISLFIPKTGLRNFPVSLFLIVSFISGFLISKKSNGFYTLLTSTTLALIGLILAGTGFSRYWLILLPTFLIGYYFLFEKFKLKPDWFVIASKIICILYIINELRIDYIIIQKHFPF